MAQIIIVAIFTSLIVAAATAIAVSIVCCNISAIKTFNTIDGYVKDMINSTKQLIRDTYLDKRTP